MSLSSKEANADNGVHTFEVPRRRHSILGQLLLMLLSEQELSFADVVVVTNSKTCNLDPVDPTSITFQVSIRYHN